MSSPFQVIDPHVHYWSLKENNQPWLADPQPNLLGDYSPMAHDHLPENLEQASDGIEVLATVHVEADATDPIAETRWLSDLMEKEERLAPSALVVGVDLSQDDAEAVLDEHMSLSTHVRGVRQILNVHTNPLFDYVGRHYMRERLWKGHFALLADRNLSFDLQIYPSQMAEAATLARQHADTQFVLNHAGMYVDRMTLAGWQEWRDGLHLLGHCPNVSIKLSGFGMLDHHWTPGSIRPLIWEAIDVFGVERALFASNFPVDGLYASYTQLWQAYADIVSGVSEHEFARLFRDNARSLYRL